MSARDRYSRTVALLKVIFPLIALGILSTLFLISRALDTDTQIPFADKEIQDRLRDQQITGPFFSGSSPDGDRISFSADRLITLGGQVGTNRAETVRAQLESAAGATFVLTADLAELDIADDTALLSGDVSLESSAGYRINTDALTARVSALDITAPDGVQAIGPPGRLTAGKMRVFRPKDAEATQMLFSDGVKLIYIPPTE